MARIVEFVEDNYNVIQVLFGHGKISPTLINEYHIYQEYLKLSHIKSKMERYSIISDMLKISDKSVIRAVSNMEREV